MSEIPSAATLYVHDLDHTLLDTKLVVEEYRDFIAIQDRDLAQGMYENFENAAAGRKSVNVQTYLKGVLDDVSLSRLNTQFVDRMREDNVDLLHTGANDLLQYLQFKGGQNVILTKGSRSWQTIKLRASGLDSIPHIVTKNVDKGADIATWRRPSGAYKLPDALVLQAPDLANVAFGSVILSDDRQEAFTSLPSENTRGYLVDHRHKVGEITTDYPHLTLVHTLTEIGDSEINY